MSLLIWPECQVPEESICELQMDDMPGDCRIRWVFVARNHVFSDRLVSEGAMRSSADYFHHGTYLSSMVMSVTENGMEAEI
jgi:hypothetical protein